MKRLLVLARNADEVRRFCQDHNIPVTAVCYVVSEHVTRGFQDPAYVVLDGFWERIDAMGIWMTLQRCMTTPLDLPNKLQPAARVSLPPIVPASTTGTWTQPAPSTTAPVVQAPIELDDDGLPPLPEPPEPEHVEQKKFKKIRVPK